MSLNIQTSAAKLFSDLTESTKKDGNKVVASGRFSNQADTEPAIWDDIQQKLRLDALGSHGTALDIGCGYSNIATWFSELAHARSWQLTLLDVPTVINAMDADLKPQLKANLRFVQGLFPDVLKSMTLAKQYDRVVAYSVLHYSDDPGLFIDEACKLLAPGGRLLIGDIPNASRKGRFLASASGREFDAKYKGIPLTQAPMYLDHFDYIKKNPGPGTLLSDELLVGKMQTLREKGFEVFIAEQPSTLPFCYTREDLIVMRHG